MPIDVAINEIHNTVKHSLIGQRLYLYASMALIDSHPVFDVTFTPREITVENPNLLPG